MVAVALFLFIPTVAAQVKSPHEGYECHLKNKHTKLKASPEPGLANGVCKQYLDNSCCKASTATTVTALYGTDYSPERCGAISAGCLAALAEESCAYECDVNWGRYRHHDVKCGEKHDNAAKGTNHWQVSGIPISVSPPRTPPPCAFLYYGRVPRMLREN